ncbi:hypothetical protein COOONC_13770 [Cooperia oncophora]
MDFAGLPYFDTPITEEMARDHNLMRKAIESETPKLPAGRSSGYHLLTYGWLADQIVRHTDEKHRGVGQYFREEIAKPHVHRLKTLIQNSPVARAMANPSWFDVAHKCTANDPEQHAMEQAAALGIGNARSLASIFSLLVNGRLVSERTLEYLERPVLNETDYILNVNTVKGHGFFYAPLKDSDVSR